MLERPLHAMLPATLSATLSASLPATLLTTLLTRMCGETVPFSGLCHRTFGTAAEVDR